MEEWKLLENNQRKLLTIPQKSSIFLSQPTNYYEINHRKYQINYRHLSCD